MAHSPDSMFPSQLFPTGIQNFTVGDLQIEVSKCTLFFNKWTGQPVIETFGGKPIIEMNGKPMFAELAIMSLFIKSGWQSRWIETYGKSNKDPIFLSEWKDDKFKNQLKAPIGEKAVLNCLAKIAEFNNNSYSGCWDVIGWNGEQILFAESKRKGRDRIRETQISWLAAGLKQGLKKDNFLVVEWDFS